MSLDVNTQEHIHMLWDTLAGVPASTPEAALDKLYCGLSPLIDSPHGVWVATLRLDDETSCDALLGWRVRSVYFHREQILDQETYKRAVKLTDSGITDESAYNHVRKAGTFRATLLQDNVRPDYFDGAFYKTHYLARGIRDRLFVVIPVNEDTESYFMFDRLTHQDAFTPKDLEVVSYALRSLTWFNRQLHLSHGLVMADKPLTVTERGVLRQLLKGDAEKVIASTVGQSPHTTHQHVMTLFRKFNVRSRAELTALWLGH